MIKYSLLNEFNYIIREMEAEEKPADPVGKGWRWVETVVSTPVLGEDEVLTNTLKVYDEAKDCVLVSTEKEEIKTTKADVTAERDRRLNKKTTISLAGVGDVVVRLTSDYINSVQSLVLVAMAKVIRNEVGITFTFRDEDNTNWTLTPDQVIDLMIAIELEIRDIIEASWLIKDDEDLPDTLKELKKDPRWP